MNSLVKKAQSPKPKTRSVAVNELGALVIEAINALAERKHDVDSSVAFSAQRALHNIMRSALLAGNQDTGNEGAE